MTCDYCENGASRAFEVENPSPFVNGEVTLEVCGYHYEEIQDADPNICAFCDSPALYTFDESNHEGNCGPMPFCGDHYDPLLNKFKAQLDD